MARLSKCLYRLSLKDFVDIPGDHESLVMGQSSITPKVDKEFLQILVKN